MPISAGLYFERSRNAGIVMARLLSIDYGTKRTGIAITDELQIIASGLTTVDTKELLKFLKEYTSKGKG